MNHEHQNRADLCIAQGALTNSKRPETFVRGVYPTHLKRGQGAYTWDYEDKKYVDFITGLGSSILGFAHEGVNRAISERLSQGCTLSLGTLEEVECAEKVKQLFPFVDCMKFLKTGSEAASASIKIARAFHGCSDGCQEMQEMWIREILERISQGQEQEEWISRTLQKLHPEIYAIAARNRNKKESAEKIFKNSEGDKDRKELLSKETFENEKEGSSGSLQYDEKSFKLRGTHQELVRAMWKREIRSTSPRLQSASQCDLALSTMSCKRARWLILSDAYHGFHDEFVSLTHPAIGVPPHFGILPLIGNEDLIPIAAAVIIEPVITDFSNERIQWLRFLREACTKNDTLLIFDEIVTGFRWPSFSVANYYGIEPDIICLGKAMANGMPISCVAGKKEIMNCDEYFVSSTFAGETLSLVAAKKTMELLQTKYRLKDLWEKGEAWLSEFNSFYPEKIKIEGYPTRGRFVGDEETKALLFQGACEAGILLGPSWFFNFSHMECDDVISTLKEILCKIKTGNVKLKGEFPKSAFAEKMRKKA